MDFEDYVIQFFKDKYKIDLTTAPEIVIDKFIFPNYITTKVLNINNEEYTNFEYYRIINKLFGYWYNDTKLSYYESDKVQITKDDIVFDCGANTGIFTLYSSYKAKHAYAFEPMTLIRHYLRNTITYNYDKITVVPSGVNNFSTKAYLNQADNPGASRLAQFEMPNYHKVLFKELVTLVAIDDFVKNYGVIPTFIKMDIENSELNALQGAINTLNMYKPKCSISIHENNINQLSEITALFPKDYQFLIKDNEEYYDPILFCWVDQ